MRIALRFIACVLLAVLTPACAEEAPAARTLVLVRHGHYVPDPKADAKLGPGLSTLGVAQARLVGARLAGLPYRFDRVLVSPLQRARETAQVIVADLPGATPTVVPELEECSPATWRAALVADTAADEQAACAARLDRFFAEHFRPAAGHEQRELLVAHGNVIRYLATKALKVDAKAWLEMSIGHTSITTVRVEPDGQLRLIGLGDVGHVPPNLQTGSIADPERSLAPPSIP